jgi:hypothetical protein
MERFKHLRAALLALLAVVAVSLGSSRVSYANANNVVVELADPHTTNYVLTKGQSLWIVAHEPFVFSFDWPMTDKKFWNPPPAMQITPTNAAVFEFAVIADGLSDQDKIGFGMALDDMPLHVFVAKNPGQTDVKVTITPKIPGKQPFSETLHITVQ